MADIYSGLWNYGAPPQTGYIRASVMTAKGAMVIRTTWIADERRWEGLGKGQEPYAWLPEPEPAPYNIEAV